MIHIYVMSTTGIRIASVRKDSGFSGVDFLRPSFGEMMKDIEAGIINCVIVKDLSRLGRNYIEVGELMEDIFPRHKVRLIAVNDNYDSLNPRSDADDILIPFRNLINEQISRDTSGKIRASLEVKRKNGDFVGAFAPYGYKRDEENRSKLVIDAQAAEIVKDIFRLKIEGISAQKIASKLNQVGEPSPAEYKKRDTNYIAPFQTKARATWSGVTIGRILRNPVYTGLLVQGKQTTPNYKVKHRIDRSENEWHITHEAHDAIIGKRDFEIVQGLLRQDSRAAPQKTGVYPLSGMAFCGDCGNNMVRTKSGTVFYYVCGSSRAKDKSCTSHCVQEKKLERAVLDTIACQIALAIDMEKNLDYVKSLPRQQKDIATLTAQISDREQEIKAKEGYKRSLYEDYKSGILSKDDYIQFGQDYTTGIEELQQATARLREEVELLFADNSPAYEWLGHFSQHKHIQSLSRQLTVNLIERIEVFTGRRISVDFRFQEEKGELHHAKSE